MKNLLILIALLTAWPLLGSKPAFSQTPPRWTAAESTSATTMPILNDVGIDQKINEFLPLQTVFNDEHGQSHPLSDFFHSRPVILALVYYNCPSLCTMSLNSLLGTLKTMKETAGKDFDVLVVSFDSREKAPLANAKKASYLRQYNRPGAESGWHFLTGDQAAIDTLTRAVGFRYAWDEKNQQFAHASGIIVMTPQGKIFRYFFGIDYAPKDVVFTLQEAQKNRTGTLTERVLLYCYHYDPTTGKYSLAVFRIIQAGALIILAGLAAFFFFAHRFSNKRAAADIGAAAPHPPETRVQEPGNKPVEPTDLPDRHPPA